MKWPSLIWRRPGGLEECPYFRLTKLDFGLFSIRVHEWAGDDDHRAYHDHPNWFLTFVLKGGYTDESPDMRPEVIERLGEPGKVYDVLRAGAIRYRRADFAHKVINVRPGTVTLLIAGRPSRRWGFWLKGKLIKRDRYFVEHGHHGCTPNAAPIRRRPDGSRV